MAALKEDKLEGMEVDPAGEAVRWGSIYWAKITSVNAALDAVFLDLDGENAGILYNGDTRWVDKDGKAHKGGSEAIGKRYKSGQFIAVQAKAAYLLRDDDEFTGQENKTPQMSMDITLPGRYLIYAGTMRENRISSRIRDKKLRTQLMKMLDVFGDVNGCILRSAAAGTQTDMLRREGKILKGAWEEIQTHFTGNKPKLIALGPDALQRMLSDQAAQHIERIEIVTMDHFNQVEDWCAVFAPDLITKVKPIEIKNATQDLALFSYRDILGQIEDLFQPYTLLKGGGSLIIQSTAALTAIDVNKGSAKGSNLAVNLEAAQEIARQIRLRNSGGAILIDFLKFQSKADETKLLQALERWVNDDPCTVQIHGTTKLGLVEITRKRRTPALEERFEGDL